MNSKKMSIAKTEYSKINGKFPFDHNLHKNPEFQVPKKQWKVLEEITRLTSNLMVSCKELGSRKYFLWQDADSTYQRLIILKNCKPAF